MEQVRGRPAAAALWLALLGLLPPCVAAAGDTSNTEFAMNFFTDIAPVISLFGDQFATQFLSESVTWLDHLIFAAVPLGIAAAITAAIRVQGPDWARAFIGRARENRALAEIQLMSSTSGEVCEVFNGSGIVRAMGRPKLAQIIVFPDLYDESLKPENSDDKICGIHTLETAVDGDQSVMTQRDYHSNSYNVLHGLLRRVRQLWTSTSKAGDVETSKVPTRPTRFAGNPPNMQINLSSDRRGGRVKIMELFFAAVLAVVFQTGLIAIAAATVFAPSLPEALSNNPPTYALPSYVLGSILLFLGMGACSMAIEQSTVEHEWFRHPPNIDTISRPPEDVDDRLVDAKKKTRDIKKVRQVVRRAVTVSSQTSATSKRRPRIIWLQAHHSVNDQTFDSFVVLGGAKRRILTSARWEDAVAPGEEGEVDEALEPVQLTQGPFRRVSIHPRVGSGKLSPSTKPRKLSETLSRTFSLH